MPDPALLAKAQTALALLIHNKIERLLYLFLLLAAEYNFAALSSFLQRAFFLLTVFPLSEIH